MDQKRESVKSLSTRGTEKEKGGAELKDTSTEVCTESPGR